MPPHLSPHERIEFVRAQVALRAALAGSGAQEVVSGAIVVVMKGAVAPTHAMARRPQVTHPAAHQSAQQVVPGLEMARAKAAVVGMDRLRAPEQLLADQWRDADRNPLGHRPAPSPPLR